MLFGRGIFYGLIRWTSRVAVLVLSLAMALLMFLQYPFIQTHLAQELSDWLREKAQIDTRIGGVHIDWFDLVHLNEVVVYDSAGVALFQIGTLDVDYRIRDLFNKEHVVLDQVALRNGAVNLVRREKLNINEFIDKIGELAGSPVPSADRTKKTKPFIIRQAVLDNMAFSYHKPNTPLFGKQEFNYNHFGFQKISGHVKDFKLHRDTIELQAQHLAGLETSSELPIHGINTFFRYTRQKMLFRELHAAIGQSVVKDSLVFVYENPEHLSEFTTMVEILANFNQSVIHSQDLSCFITALKGVKDVYTLSGRFRGRFNNFGIYNLDFYFGEKSHLLGKAFFRGLPNMETTLMNFNFFNAHVTTKDLSQYIPEREFQLLTTLGNIDFNARFMGFFNDFVTYGRFYTSLGYLETDIKFETANASYTGDLKTVNFNLGKFIDMEEYMQNISLKGQIKGNGLTTSTARFDLKANIDKFQVMRYNYQKISTNGRFERELFNGKFSVKDPNLMLTVDGEINLKEETFNFWAELDTVNFHAINLTKDTIFLKTIVDAKFEGLSWETLGGKVDLLETYFTLNGRHLDLDFLHVSTSKNQTDGERKFNATSDLFKLNAWGSFDAQQLYVDALSYLSDFTRNILLDELNDQIQSLKKPADTQKTGQGKGSYLFSFELDMVDVNQVASLFVDSLYISPNTQLSGTTSFGDLERMLFRFHSDSLFWRNVQLYDNDMILFTSRVDQQDSTDYAFETRFTSASQTVNQLKTKSLLVEAYKLQNRIVFESSVDHQGSNDNAALSGNMAFFQDRTEISLGNTSFRFLDRTWKNAGINKIVWRGQNIRFIDLSFSNATELVRVDGTLSSDTSKVLDFELANFDLNTLSPYLRQSLKGRLNIKAACIDLYQAPKVSAAITATEVYFENFEIGQLMALTQWQDERRRLLIDAEVSRRDDYSIQIDGAYSFANDPGGQLALQANLQAAPLKLLEPFLREVASEIEGFATGELTITGQPFSPLLAGMIDVNEGKFRVNYLNTTYRFDDAFTFTRDTIRIANFKVRDPEGNQATLNGLVYRNRAKDFLFDIRSQMRNFLVLNTSASPSALYYGTAYGTGTARFYGPLNSFHIDIDAKTERNTRIYIPLETTEEVVEQDYIRFVSKEIAQPQGSPEAQELNLGAVLLKMNLEITPEAYCEIIFDQKSGDIIRGNAKGKLTMDINTQGEFKMYGDVQIVKGAYNFTLLNIIDKRFNILPNSHITWSGDPYKAILDVSATYTQTASLAPIIQADSSILNTPEIRRRYPVQVVLNLKGELLNPTVDFGIEIRNYPAVVVANGVPISLESYIAAFRQRLLNDEQELNRQVFSLIVLKRLSQEAAFNDISQSAGGSVSELLANQLSHWISKVDDKLEIDIDLNGLSQEALNTFQLRLSYNLLDGRLRVTRDGTFTNVHNQADFTSVFGDVTIEYMLRPDGRLRAKMYHKTNINAFNTGLDNNSVAGMSIMHTTTFDNFFRKKEKDRKKTPGRQPEEFVPIHKALPNEEDDTVLTIPLKKTGENP